MEWVKSLTKVAPYNTQLVLNYLEQMTRVSKGVSYLKRPVEKQGIMQQKLNGTVELDGEVIPEGTRFEYQTDVLWHYGILRQDKKTKKYFITNWNGDMEIERIEQLPARIRKAQE